MKFFDRLKEDINKINKFKNKKDKLIFIWDYYRIHIFIVLLVLFIAIYGTIHVLFGNKDILNVVLVNSDSAICEVESDVFTEELQKAGIDIKNKNVNINDYLTIGISENKEADVETLQVLTALFTVGDMDIFVSFKDNFDFFKENDAFVDLSLLIDKDILNNKIDDLYKYKDSSGQEIVGGIVLHDDSLLHKAHYYHNDVIIGIVNNGSNMENAVAFVRQILVD